MISRLRRTTGGAFPPFDEASLSLQVGRTLALGIVQPEEHALPATACSADAEDGTLIRLRLALFSGLHAATFTCHDWNDIAAGETYLVEGSSWLSSLTADESCDLKHYVLAFQDGQFECLARSVEFSDRVVRLDLILSALRGAIETHERSLDQTPGSFERRISASSA